METQMNLTLLTKRLTAFQISRAVDLDMQTAQKMIDNEIDFSELDPHIIEQLNDLCSKLIKRD